MLFLKQPWSLPTSHVLEILKSSESGLSDREAEARLKEYGLNILHGKEKGNALLLFAKQFASPLIFLLMFAAILTGVLKEWPDMIFIAFAILLNVFLGFYHEHHAENTIRKLSTYIKDRTRVFRDGREEEIDSSLLVCGDVIQLSYGSRVPADARVLEVNNFRVDEAVLTGESLPIEKITEMVHADTIVAERKNIVHAGSLVVAGYATAVVFATDDDTEIGKIAGMVSKIRRIPTPLQKGVGRLAWFIFAAVIVIVLGVFLLGISHGEPILHMLLLSAAVAVGAVPEALPIVLTVILSIGAEHIARKKGIVRKLAAAETLGSASLVMTDKTGTLTMADMQLVGVYDTETILGDKKTSDAEALTDAEKKLLELAMLNVDVTVENSHLSKEEWSFRGRAFEVNIVKAGRKHAVPLDAILKATRYLILPFNSSYKFSVAEKNGKYVVMGAPDILLKRSNVKPADKERIEKWITETSNAGKRLIGLATFSMKDKKTKESLTPEHVKEIDFLGMLVFYDPIRPEVPEALKSIEAHGIKMVLVTGDLPGTALSVAKSLNWHVKESEVVTGMELASMTDDELFNLVPKIKIFARVTPEDKLRIGRLYQKHGEIVAMTGDGVNDAPALKAMDIGISVGSGSDVAKSAADLVLLNDNFETISLVIDEGRRILNNIRKALAYLLTNCLDGVFMVGGSILFGLAMPLTALQIIWVNLFTGSLPALAFAFDENLDKEKFSKKEAGLILTREVKVMIAGVGTVSSLLLFILYYLLIKSGMDVDVARSIFFACFSSYILVVAFCFRSLYRPLFSYPIFGNKKLNIIILVSIIILIMTMTVPPLRDLFDIAPMPLLWTPFIFVWLVLNVVLIEGAKYWMRKIKFRASN